MLDDLLELRTGDQVPADGIVRSAPTDSRSTSRCSPASPTRSTSRPAPRCCRAASWSRARVGSRRRAVGAGRPTPASSPRRPGGSRSPAPSSSTASTRCCGGSSTRCSRSAIAAARGASSATTASPRRSSATVARDRRHGARGPGAAHEPGVRHRGGDARPAQRARPGAPGRRGSGPRRRGVSRQDGHAHRGRRRVRHASRCSPAVDEHRGRRRAGRARRRRRTRNATLRAIGAAFPAPDGLVAHRRDPVLVGPQVERRRRSASTGRGSSVRPR